MLPDQQVLQMPVCPEMQPAIDHSKIHPHTESTILNARRVTLHIHSVQLIYKATSPSGHA